MVKPFTKADLYSSIEICLHNFSQQNTSQSLDTKVPCLINDALFIKDGLFFHKISFQDILYLESENVYVGVITEKKKILVRSSMQQYLENFPKDRFLRVHRSFVVNIQHIDSISVGELIVKSRKVPIGKMYRKELLSKLKLG